MFDVLKDQGKQHLEMVAEELAEMSETLFNAKKD